LPAAKAAGKAAQERSQVSQAGESLDNRMRKRAELEADFEEEVQELGGALRPEAVALLPMPIRPRKGDITVEQVVLAWAPWKIGAQGKQEPAF
jgi:hypothetical protein